MIQISPAILTTEVDQIQKLITSYIEAGFDSIDIDIQSDEFVSDPTINFEAALKAVSELEIPQAVSLGWDLKIKQPKKAVEQILEQNNPANRIYVYSSAEIRFLEDLDLTANNIGVGVLGDVALKGIQFYSGFPEVQFMTISSEKQGSKLDPNLLDRVTYLRDMGYEGAISIDGGVNLRSAELINAYAKEIRIDRVSVGSYFQKSDNLALDKQKLELALNI